jgi:hypothetical protein
MLLETNFKHCHVIVSLFESYLRAECVFGQCWAAQINYKVLHAKGAYVYCYFLT